MATAESAGKTCVVCGKDVSGQPRVKDAAGKYMCAGECQQKAIAAAKARKDSQPGPTAQAKAPMAPGGLLGQLIDDSPMLKSAKCESCGSAMPGGSVICTRCGFNTQTGKALKTAVIVEKEKKEAKTPASRYSNKYSASDFGPSFGVLFLIVLGPIAALAVLGFVSPMFAIAGLGIASLVLSVGSIWGLVSAFIAGDVGWAIASLLLPFAQPIYMLFFSEDKWSKALYLGALAGIVVVLAMVFGPIGADEFQKAIGP